jgi:diguanylate cyclase (GGDEF)-like protein
MTQTRFDPASSPAITSIVRAAVIVATVAFFAGALMNAVLGQRDAAVILALAAPLGISAWGFVRAGHNEAALALLCCVLVSVITVILMMNPLGVHDMAVTAYAGVVSFGAMLFSRRAYVAITGLTLFAATAAFVYDLGGYSRSVVAGYSSWPQYLDFLLIVCAFAFLGRIVAEKLYGSLGEAHVAGGSDPVTGLYNRAGFMAAANLRLRAAQASAESAVLVIADLDGFRRMNLVVGLESADRVLQDCARRLMGECGGDLVGRIGDDEFAVLRLGMHETHASEFARVVHKALRFELRGAEVDNAAGYARFPRDGTTVESLMLTAASGVAAAQAREVAGGVAGPADRI